MVVVISVLLWTDFPNTVANEIANGLKVEISEVHITGMSLSTGIEVQVLSELNMNYGGVVSSCAHTLISKGAGLLNTVNLRPSTIKLYFPNDNGEYDKKKDSDMASTAREDIYVAQADIPFTVLNIGDHTTTKLSFTTKIHNFRNPKTMSKMAYMLINNESFEVLGQMDLIIAKGWLRTGHINLAITEIVNPSGGVFNSTMLEYTKSSYHNFGHALSSLNDFSIKENSEL
ncbi:hypothetical protein NADFUDRAFT_84027 [Nadsonia fulvescens var. elongata DSM 6958]|uniref:Uncharacterized protein n=1 Tax=Nadsonia fulvescens var. elongata DSM 6958 TaxID=857566 RepID=A0A1E3PGC1_9ASCO|nr:hypothetical protein NADFUDRAFT_84027 [Nadsonia fulvescens var. elongata DSM 6958]